MRLGAPFFILISLINGYVLWSWAIITPGWTVMPGYPLAEPGRTVRMLCVLLVIAAVFVVNFGLHKFSGKNDIARVILNTVISSNIALVFTLVLSQILDSTYGMPSPLMYDTIAYLQNNPSVLIGIIVVVNVLAAVSGVLVWGVFVGINKALGKSTETDVGADL